MHHETHTAAAKNPISAFSRIHPMNPEPPPPAHHQNHISPHQPLAPRDAHRRRQNPISTFPRINPMNPENNKNPDSPFLRLNPLNREPGAFPGPPANQHIEPTQPLTSANPSHAPNTKRQLSPKGGTRFQCRQRTSFRCRLTDSAAGKNPLPPAYAPKATRSPPTPASNPAATPTQPERCSRPAPRSRPAPTPSPSRPCAPAPSAASQNPLRHSPEPTP